MTRPFEFSSQDIELSACLLTAGGKLLRITPGRELTEFTFLLNETSQETVFEYSAGTLCQKVRPLVKNRSWLYRQIREVSRTGRGVHYD